MWSFPGGQLTPPTRGLQQVNSHLKGAKPNITAGHFGLTPATLVSTGWLLLATRSQHVHFFLRVMPYKVMKKDFTPRKTNSRIPKMMAWKMYLLSNMAILGIYIRFQGVFDWFAWVVLCSEKGAAGLEGNTYLGYHWNTAKQISKFDHPYREVHQSIDTYGYLTCIRHSSWTCCLVGDFLLFSPPFGRNMFWTFAKHRRIRSETCLLLWGIRESSLPKQTKIT